MRRLEKTGARLEKWVESAGYATAWACGGGNGGNGCESDDEYGGGGGGGEGDGRGDGGDGDEWRLMSGLQPDRQFGLHVAHRSFTALILPTSISKSDTFELSSSTCTDTDARLCLIW